MFSPSHIIRIHSKFSKCQEYIFEQEFLCRAFTNLITKVKGLLRLKDYRVELYFVFFHYSNIII